MYVGTLVNAQICNGCMIILLNLFKQLLAGSSLDEADVHIEAVVRIDRFMRVHRAIGSTEQLGPQSNWVVRWSFRAVRLGLEF